LVAEEYVSFDYEISCIGVRSKSGDVVIYPLSRNEHSNGILRISRSPVDSADQLECATAFVRRLLDHLDYVGVLTLELFVVGDALLANEFAPRVHNSGHWTIEGSATSQFENHLRAIIDAPLGSTESYGHAGMINLIGRIPDVIRSLENVCLHDYGKAPRPARKLGHVTVIEKSAEQRDKLIVEISKKCDAIDPAD
jgi:5-(carboxyamino)imidazole ribonucleotide synthase